MSDELLSHADGAVHRLTINRPARRNALTPTLARALAAGAGRGRGVGRGGARGAARRGRPLLAPDWTCTGSAAWARFPPSPTCSTDSATFRRPCSPSCAARCRCSPWSRAPPRGSGSIWPSPATCGSPSRDASFTSAFARMGAGARRRLHLHPAAAGRDRPGAPAAAGGRDDRRGPRAGHRPGGRGGRTRRQLDAEVATLASASDGGRHVERPRDQAAGPGRRRSARWSRCWRPRARRSSRRCRGRVPPAAGGVHRAARRTRGGRVSAADRPGPRRAPSSGPTCSPGGWPWSPAAAPGSAWASPRAWPRPARRWPSPAGSRSTSSRPPRPLRGAGRAGERRRDQRARARGGGPHGRAGGRRARPARHPGQQRGGQLLRAVGHACRPTPGARWSRPTSTAASTARRRSTRS